VRKIVVSQFVSLDGVIEDPVGMEGLGRGAWSSQVDSGADGGRYKVEEMLGSDAMLMGRATYDAYAAAWPARGGEYADKINTMPKYVVSSTLENPDWNNTTVLCGDVPADVARLKEQPGGDILIHGSAQLVDTLIEHDLIDVWRLMVFPVVVGTGKRCFGDPGQSLPLTLTDCRAVGDGVVILTYGAARP
jgi:dihydrofolate reductase